MGGGLNHFDRAGVFRARLDDKRCGADESLEVGTLFQSDSSGAENLAADVAIDEGGGGVNRVQKFDARAFFNPQVAAGNLADDFSMTADNEIATAFDGAGEFTEHGEIVALQGDPGDRTGFLDDHVTASLDTAVPWLGDFVIDQADVAAAFGALAGLRFRNRGVGIGAGETADLTGRLGRVEQAHEERPRRRLDRPTPEHGHGFCLHGWRFRFGIRILARLGEPGDGMVSHHAFAFADLEVRAAGPALGRDDECGLGLDVSALGARHFDAMALGLIGHGRAKSGSGGGPSNG